MGGETHGGGRPRVSGGTIVAALAASALLHLGLYASVAGEPAPPPPANEPVEFEVVETEPPPPPPPEPEPEPEPEPAPPPKPVAKAEPPPPPPPNAPPPAPEPEPAAPPPVKIGISLGSTTEAGSFSVGVGNSLYGKADEKAADPSAVKPYVAPKRPSFVPSTRISRQPKMLSQPRAEYPLEARRAGVEGQVKLLVKIDERGKVVGVKVLKGPGFGLEAAAEKAAWAWRFEPAEVDGEPVGTEVPLTYTFYLD